MDFKFSSSVFKNSAEDQKRLYGDKYDPDKNYPNFTGNLTIPKGQLLQLVQYLHWALRTDVLKHDDYVDDVVVPIKVSGWAKDSKSGKKFLSLQYTPDYKTMMAAKEAKEAHEIAQHQQSIDEKQSVDDAAASLAQGTAGTVVEAVQDDFF